MFSYLVYRIVQVPVYHPLLAGNVSLMHVFALSLPHSAIFPLILPHSSIHRVPFPSCRVCVPDAYFPLEFTSTVQFTCVAALNYGKINHMPILKRQRQVSSSLLRNRIGYFAGVHGPVPLRQLFGQGPVYSQMQSASGLFIALETREVTAHLQ